MKARLATERFWEKVEKTDTCWLWTGSVTKSGGYGQLSIHNRPVRAHRFAYELIVGPIPEGLRVCHHCDVPRCVRPDHLFLGTAKDNTRDMMAKKRMRRFPRGDEHPTRTAARRERYETVVRLHGEGMTNAQIARQVGLTDTAVGHMVNGKTWR